MAKINSDIIATLIYFKDNNDIWSAQNIIDQLKKKGYSEVEIFRSERELIGKYNELADRINPFRVV
jgi:hypothetical protein